MTHRQTHRSRPDGQSRPVTVQAIGPQGWAVAERMVDHSTPLVVEQAADELRATVRSDSGWLPRLVVLDEQGRDVTAAYDVN